MISNTLIHVNFVDPLKNAQLTSTRNVVYVPSHNRMSRPHLRAPCEGVDRAPLAAFTGSYVVQRTHPMANLLSGRIIGRLKMLLLLFATAS